MAYDEKTAERVRKLLSGRRDVVEKKMMGGLSFMVKGGMCCSVSGRGGLLIRIGADAQERILHEPHVQPVSAGGRQMTSFIRVSPEGYRTDSALSKWVERGLAFVVVNPTKPSRGKPRRKTSKRRSSK
jgi:TfoX/Sxy family transcriptional regulator of competence genes